MTDVKSVSEQVQELRESWNPAPKDATLERVVGVNPEPGDTRATSHVPMEVLNRRMDSPHEDDADASELKGAALDKALEERGLPKTGSADEKRQRVAEYDADNNDDEGDE